MKNVLIFPFIQGRDFFIEDFLSGYSINVFKANSERESRNKNINYLPRITDKNFKSELLKLIKKQKIDCIYTSHNIVHRYFLEQNFLQDLKFFQKSPHEMQKSALTNLSLETNFVKSKIQELNLKSQELALDQLISAILIKYNSIHGECSINKLASLTAVIMDIYYEPGNWVEIGCLYGKSFTALNTLNSLRLSGLAFAVDSWDPKLATQNSNLDIVSNSQNFVDFNAIYSLFRINFQIDIINNKTVVLKNESKSAAKDYLKFTQDPISLLHIDGNHDYEEVKQDFDLWEKYLANNSWIIFDDYKWAYGDGPAQVANWVLFESKYCINHSFYSGGALFINATKN